MSSSQEQQQIDQYLRGKMNAGQQRQFEKMLRDRVDLQNALDEARITYAAAKLMGAQKLKTTLVQHESNRKAVSRRIWLRASLIAASLALVLGVGLVWLIPTSPDSDQIFASYFEPYRADVALRDAAASQTEDRLMEAYQQKDFETAISLYEQQLESNESPSNSINFYLAIAYLTGNVDQAEKAKPILERLSQSENPYTQQAKWYLALCLVKLQKLPQARALLQDIEKEKSYKFEEAIQLLQKLTI